MVYKGGPLITRELLEEMQECGLIPEEMNRKIAMSAIRRACDGLVRRGLLKGEVSAGLRLS